ncbi:Uncharacterised protein [Vibrio cholerae]|nr:Uncharacterised protein [Vibrio cholerae]CSA63637.1 Uncharacterised protein [Vibrio cholerae]CSB85258.1 Uncharacterised protein [Vibrio cholerae]CSC75457.1 Uncharacterised protein [Vibrio cholerae]CSD09741.1 Uncharacterised protein [Vibrio cholerae]
MVDKSGSNNITATNHRAFDDFFLVEQFELIAFANIEREVDIPAKHIG